MKDIFTFQLIASIDREKTLDITSGWVRLNAASLWHNLQILADVVVMEPYTQTIHQEHSKPDREPHDNM